ncbi:MAG: Fe-S cluster assembly protein SufD [Actinobacteria bacterium]|nr:Fe-S cluster assembly protein SufD [Actinomycetota bacterium]
MLRLLGEVAGLALVRNGKVVRCELDEEATAAGVRLSLAEASDEAIAAPPVDVFGELNAEHVSAPVVVDIPDGVRLTRPIAVIDWLDADGVMTFPRLAVRLGEASAATLVEWYGSTNVDSFAAPVTTLDVSQAATFSHVAVQHRGPRVWQIANQVSTVGKDAMFNGYQAALGGDYARSRADCRLAGRGASGNLSAVYFGTGDQMLDFRTFQHHQGPDTTSNLLFKGAVGGRSRSVYTGLIRVEKQARGTNAFQTNRNIKLSDHAWAESVPNLEIENNDVRCSHASTVGPVDEEQRFYLESRGVPTAVAERLIVTGFFDEVLVRLPVDGVSAGLRGLVRDRLDHEGVLS